MTVVRVPNNSPMAAAAVMLPDQGRASFCAASLVDPISAAVSGAHDSASPDPVGARASARTDSQLGGTFRILPRKMETEPNHG
jgi:hypothetical protein